jgi:hypothetical protein
MTVVANPTACMEQFSSSKWRNVWMVLFLVLQPPVGHGLLTHVISISHTMTHDSR